MIDVTCKGLLRNGHAKRLYPNLIRIPTTNHTVSVTFPYYAKNAIKCHLLLSQQNPLKTQPMCCYSIDKH